LGESFDDFLERERQRARRRLGIGPGDHCSYLSCAESDPLQLTGSRDDLLCYEHRSVQHSRLPVEYHHPATKNIESAFAAPTFGNDHRVLTVMSKRWIADLKDVKSSVVRMDLARLAGLRDVERQLVDKYGDTVERLLDVVRYFDEAKPGWEQDFERWRDSKDRRDA
jgi:hypothetical protein